jgi:hypothetical protein
MVRMRNAEKDLILSTLGEEWESEDDLVQALFDRFFELIEARNFYGIKWGSLAYGPFSTKATAEKICRLLDDVAVVAPLISVNSVRAILDKANPAADQQHCLECKHPRFAHGFPRPAGCAVKGCDCLVRYK